jgi:uncharacterized membrane protein YbhN (UPF0104 family)
MSGATRAALRVAARLAGGVAILGCLIWRLGAGPFVDGLRAVSVPAVVAAALLAGGTTTCAAWRWTLVARGLGVPLSLRTAVAASYRAQFLNTVLPGGVLGDLHRGIRHGRDARALSKALRAVAWERIAGQLVQILLAVLALSVLPSPWRARMPLILAVLVAAGIALVVVLRAVAHSGAGRLSGWVHIAGADIRHGVLGRQNWPGVAAASVLVVAGHLATFLIAAHAVGTDASVGRLVPLALLVLLAMAVPMNIGGWGPREGAAAWAFAAAGLGAAHGVAVATAFGVLVMAATLPGAVLLLTMRSHTRPRTEPDPVAEPSRAPVAAAGVTTRG